MRLTLPGVVRIGLLLAGLPAAATGGGVRAEPPEPGAGAQTQISAALAPVTPPGQPAAPSQTAPSQMAAPQAAALQGEAPLRQARLEFGLYALGAKAFDIKFGLQHQDDAVDVNTAMRTFGPLDFLMSFELTGHSASRLRDGHIVPVRYSTDSDGGWSKRSTRITWDADGMPVAVVQPPLTADDADPVPDALKRNTMYPTTAIVARALHAGSEPPCTGTDAIFDGRRRYNLHFAPVGPATLPPQERSAYAGPAFECAVRLEPIAGYGRNGAGADTRAIEDRVTRLWLVRPPGVDAWVPVQIDSGFSLGSVSGWIAGATLNGQTWLAPLGPIRAEIPREISP